MNFFHKVTKVDINRKRPFIKRMGRDVYVDWSLSVIVAFLIAITLSFIGFREKKLFLKNLENEVTVHLPSTSSSIDIKTLDIVLDRYTEKALRKEDLIRGYVAPKDPSI